MHYPGRLLNSARARDMTDESPAIAGKPIRTHYILQCSPLLGMVHGYMVISIVQSIFYWSQSAPAIAQL